MGCEAPLPGGPPRRLDQAPETSMRLAPAIAGSVFYDGGQSWVKALIELKGQTIEYALAT